VKAIISCGFILALCAGCMTRTPEAVRNISVDVPASLNVERTDDTFSVGFDNPRSLVPTNITVDPRQSEGVVYDVYVYRAGQPRPAEPDWYGRHEDMDFSFAPCVCHEDDEKFPLLQGHAYIVEVDAAVYEADPGYADDNNFGLLVSAMTDDPGFKILWKGHLEQTVK
jgi:hypothetical protein